MTVTPFQALTCPLDGDPLHREGISWRCPAGHSFDQARQGYLNLLPVQNKRSKDPGDSKEMVAARRRFLNSGHYRPIAEAVNRLVLAGWTGGDALSCLDAGCGEGYYLRALAEPADDRPNLALLGLDISKHAVLAAAKQDKRVAWVVGSNANLPVESASLDRVLCLFGFPVYREFARVLKPGGQLIQVDAGPDHLRELREIVYPELRSKPAVDNAEPEGFRLTATEIVRFNLTLTDAESIADLLAMTPHLYRAKPEGRARAAALTELTVTVDVRLSLYLPQAS